MLRIFLCNDSVGRCFRIIGEGEEVRIGFQSSEAEEFEVCVFGLEVSADERIERLTKLGNVQELIPTLERQGLAVVATAWTWTQLAEPLSPLDR